MLMTPFAIVWTAIAAVTVGLALYRRVVSAHETDIVYLGTGEEGNIPRQKALATRLNWIDKWGKSLTVVTLVFGLALLSIYLYGVWVEAGTTVRFE